MKQKLYAEALGSFLLFATVIGSGIMAEQLADGNMAVALLGNTAATAAMLYVLIAMLGPPSGAHFNPAVSLVMRLRGELTTAQLLAYVAVQVGGAFSAHGRRMRCLACRLSSFRSTCAAGRGNGWAKRWRHSAWC